MGTYGFSNTFTHSGTDFTVTNCTTSDAVFIYDGEISSNSRGSWAKQWKAPNTIIEKKFNPDDFYRDLKMETKQWLNS